MARQLGSLLNCQQAGVYSRGATVLFKVKQTLNALTLLNECMQQQPEKLRWRDQSSYGLSASTFGMALGFCGRISDYVRYRREIVGTPLEFKGNEATAHGCRTESKARACYEFITGHRVGDGGFFTTCDRVLACSPDGIVEISDGGKGGMGQLAYQVGQTSSQCAVGHQDDSSRHFRQTPFRLLEIKSPFKALYDGSRKLYQPHGIPLQYMCQMQGQMAISGAQECDFFVFLDTPSDCQVAGWRVKRSASFWEWCEPKLRLVSSWIRDGLPEGVDRSFRFERFDFSTLDVDSIVAPFSITHQRHLLDVRKFGFFVGYFAEQRKRKVSSRETRLRDANIDPAERGRKFQILPRGLLGRGCVGRIGSKMPNHSAAQWSIYDVLTQASQSEGSVAHSEVEPHSPLIHFETSGSVSANQSSSFPFPFNTPLTWDVARAFFGGSDMSISLPPSTGCDSRNLLRITDVQAAMSALSSSRGITEDSEILSIFRQASNSMDGHSNGFILCVKEIDWDRSMVLLSHATLHENELGVVANEMGFEVPFHFQKFWRTVTWDALPQGNGLMTNCLGGEAPSGEFALASSLRTREGLAKSPTTPTFPSEVVVSSLERLKAVASNTFPDAPRTLPVGLLPSPPPLPPIVQGVGLVHEVRPTKARVLEGICGANSKGSGSEQPPASLDAQLPISIDPHRRVAVRTLLKLTQRTNVGPELSVTLKVPEAPIAQLASPRDSPSSPLLLGLNARSAAIFHAAASAVRGKELTEGLQGLVDQFCIGGPSFSDTCASDAPTPSLSLCPAAVKLIVLMSDISAESSSAQIIFSDQSIQTDSCGTLPRYGSLICTPVAALEAIYTRGATEGMSKDNAIALDDEDDPVGALIDECRQCAPSRVDSPSAGDTSGLPSQETKVLQAKLSRTSSVVLHFARSSFCEEDEEDASEKPPSLWSCSDGALKSQPKMSSEALIVQDYLVCSERSGRLPFGSPVQTSSFSSSLGGSSSRGDLAGADKKSKFSILPDRSLRFRQREGAGAVAEGNGGKKISPDTRAASLVSPLTPASLTNTPFLIVAVGVSPPSDPNLQKKCAFLRLEWSVFERKILRAAKTGGE